MSRFVSAGVPLVGLALVGCDPSEYDPGLQEKEDVWFQAENNEVDILWVVDDSCSMQEEQETLAAGFQSFVGQMEASGTDFHIGVIPTSFEYDDPARGTLLGDPPYLTNQDDYVAGFVARAQLGVLGSDKEKGLEAAAWALSPTMVAGGPNAGFLRPTARLLVVVVSDEEDCSDRAALEGQPADACYLQKEALVPVQEFVQEFRDLKGDDQDVQIGSIVGVQNAACADAYPGSRYIQTSELTGGLVGDICLADWSGMLADLGLTATGVRNNFQTTEPAVLDTLVVTVDGVQVPMDGVDGWTYDTDSCVLTFGPNAVPARDASIHAAYTVGPGECGGSL